MRDEWTDPVCISVAQRVRTERMDMHRHRPRHKMEVRVGEWPGHIRIVPAVIQRAGRDGITLRKNPGQRTVIHHRDTNFVEMLGNFRSPMVVYIVTGGRTMRTIDRGAPTKPG